MGNRAFPHYASARKHKEMRTRLGWTFSYKSLYFVHQNLELVPLFTGMRERSIIRRFEKNREKKLKCLTRKGKLGLVRNIKNFEKTDGSRNWDSTATLL